MHKTVKFHKSISKSNGSLFWPRIYMISNHYSNSRIAIDFPSLDIKRNLRSF